MSRRCAGTAVNCYLGEPEVGDYVLRSNGQLYYRSDVLFVSFGGMAELTSLVRLWAAPDERSELSLQIGALQRGRAYLAYWSSVAQQQALDALGFIVMLHQEPGP